jgi:hypothetical protein
VSYKDSDETLRKVAADEPIFVLRAQDRFAPEVVRYWCDLAEGIGVSAGKVAEARELAATMERWSGMRKFPD